ncbi:hypothetical protein ACFSQ0_03395 [Mesonia sediminis]|uniref:Fibronectin type-III domain-containing protein n=1 Tax=Mesonia sediminis TaxID=1703946 RepID=A0ABW5SCF3_9FLAO
MLVLRKVVADIAKLKVQAYLVLVLGLLYGCTKDDESNASQNQIDYFEVSQNGSSLDFYYGIRGEFDYFEIAFAEAGYDVKAEYADFFTTSNQERVEKPIRDLIFASDVVYHFWIRGVQENGKKTDWFGPKTINISSFCENPYALEFNGYIAWNYYDNENDASFYEVEYGAQGFEVGQGQKLSSNSETIFDLSLEKNKVYDAYVRAYCNIDLGHSAWVGPVSYFAEQNQNVCLEPYNLSYFTEYNFFGDPVGASISWKDDGNNKTYEFNLVGKHKSPESSAIESRSDYGTQITYTQISPNVNYDFYVRTVCLDGSKTAWVGPLNVKIQ